MRLSVALLALAFGACNVVTNQPTLDGKDVEVRFIHTTDIHSRLVPYKMNVALTDQELGLDSGNANVDGPYGGAARMATVIHGLRAGASRVLHLDSGDVFQGAPIFNVFQGQVEMWYQSLIGVDAMAIGNHEFDSGEMNVADKIARYANFPMLAANYRFAPAQGVANPPLSDLIQAFEIFNLQGLRVGVIGLGNVSTLTSIFESGNALGITPIDSAEVTQFYVDAIRSQVDVVIVVSHLGFTEDQRLIKNTTGIDIVFGGHHHIVLNPPNQLPDCQRDSMDPTWKTMFDQEHAGCTPHNVLLVHSGAFAKYVGKLDVVFRQDPPHSRTWRVASSKYEVIPINRHIQPDARVSELIEPFVDQMKQQVQLDLILGYAPGKITRYGSTGGDSALGNLVADSMWRRKGIETDFALTNTLGIRSDIVTGPVTIDDMYQVFPFENTITTMYLSGREVVELFDYVARRSSSRGCQSQAQIAGARVKLQCGRCDCDARPKEWDSTQACDPTVQGCAVDIQILGKPLEMNVQYQLAANDYIAKGGSGFMVLKRNTTQINSGIPQRDALMDTMRGGKPCGVQDGKLRSCNSDTDCASPSGYTCACPDRVEWNAAGYCCPPGVAWDPDLGACGKPSDTASPICAGGGQCVLLQCVTDIAGQFDQFSCGTSGAYNAMKPPDKCGCDQLSRAYSQCTATACLDATNAIAEDGRLVILPP